MATNDDLNLLNGSLAAIGCHPLESISEPGPAGTAPFVIYEAVRNDLLGKYNWSFTRKFGELTRQGEPDGGWRSEFLLPPGRLQLPSSYYSSSDSEGASLKRFELRESTVLTNTDQLFAIWQQIPTAGHMPAYFRELVRLATAAELALTIREDRSLRDRLRNNAYGSEQYQGEGGQFAVATNLDAQANPSEQINANEGPVMLAHGLGGEFDDYLLEY